MNQEISLLAHQRELEKLYNKNQLVPRIKSEFMNCKDFDFMAYFEAKKIPTAFGLDLLTQMALHKRCSLPTLVGIMDKHFNDVQKTADALYDCAKADLLDWSHGLKLFIVKFTISADVQEELDRYQFPLPMVVPPKHIKHNMETGYYTSGGSIILKKNHHGDDVCLDHLNRCNKMQFKISHRVVDMVQNQWRNLDKPKSGETKDDFLKRKRAFDKYDRTCKEVIAKVTEVSDTFHLTHRPDKRGRTYCQGYHVTYQGAPWNKAAIEFANAEVVN